MSTQFQLRRGTAAQTAAFTGAPGEVTVNTTSNTLTLHDSVTPGGWPILSANAAQNVYNKSIFSANLVGTQAISGNIIPTTGNLYTLGNAAYPFKSLYVSGNTIYLGNAILSTTSNSFTIINPAGGSFSVTGDNVSGSTGIFANLQITSNTPSTSATTGALQIGGGAGIAGDVYTGGNAIIGGNLTVLGTTTTVNTEIINQSEVVTANLTVNGRGVIAGNVSTANLSVAGTITSTGSMYSGGGYFYSNGASILAGFLTNTFQGNMTLGNLTAGNITSGVGIAGQGGTIYVSASNGNDSALNAGTFNNPFKTIKAALAVAQAGQTVQVGPGVYTENNPITVPAYTSLLGNDLRTVFITPQNPNSDLIWVNPGVFINGFTLRDYNASGFAYPSTGNIAATVSPYIQNITSKTTAATSTAVTIDGNLCSSGFKAMIIGFFTIINQNGYGIVLKNSAYSQLVNIYTIGCEQGIVAQSGSFVTLNGSDTSIGNVALRADGYGPLLTYGNTLGYSALGSFNVNMNGNIAPKVNQVMIINGDTNYYSIDTVSFVGNTGTYANTWQVKVLETYGSNLAPVTNIAFYQRSAIIASAHTFEYVGAGNFMSNALPQFGGIPDPTYSVIQTNGGHVTYTATDHKGNFMIGPNLTINQVTGTITGDSFNRSMFALVTPYILALQTALS